MGQASIVFPSSINIPLIGKNIMNLETGQNMLENVVNDLRYKLILVRQKSQIGKFHLIKEQITHNTFTATNEFLTIQFFLKKKTKGGSKLPGTFDERFHQASDAVFVIYSPHPVLKNF